MMIGPSGENVKNAYAQVKGPAKATKIFLNTKTATSVMFFIDKYL